MKKKVESFIELKCWQACRDVKLFVHELIKSFPSEEKFTLSDNMRRASYSVTENIAEGYGRYHFKENIQFCRISRGSLFELQDQLITANDFNYISKEEHNEGNELISKALALLNGYINYLLKAKPKKQESSLDITEEDFDIYSSLP